MLMTKTGIISFFLFSEGGIKGKGGSGEVPSQVKGIHAISDYI